jgi:FkbM family methyltransferase
MISNGRQPATPWQAWLSRWRFRLRHKLTRRVSVVDEATGTKIRFLCNSQLDEYRARTLYVKEEGTIHWIRENVKPGESFLDIGANVGIYTLVAANCVGPTGMVYAFEPHVVNFQSLLRNVAANQFQDRVRAFACALHERSAVLDFNYYSLEPGTAMSQLGSTKDADEREFKPVACEWKLAVSVDDLIANGDMRPPTHVKLDVDGNELFVLQGMRKLLAGPNAPRTLQVEINHRYKDALYGFLEECGFNQAEAHHTLNGKNMIANGADPTSIAHNAVFHCQRAVMKSAA